MGGSGQGTTCYGECSEGRGRYFVAWTGNHRYIGDDLVEDIEWEKGLERVHGGCDLRGGVMRLDSRLL